MAALHTAQHLTNKARQERCQCGTKGRGHLPSLTLHFDALALKGGRLALLLFPTVSSLRSPGEKTEPQISGLRVYQEQVTRDP